MLTTQSGQRIAVGPRLSQGGQGEVFALTQPSDQVFKRYLPASLAKDPTLEPRLRAMVANRPSQWREEASGHIVLAWPTDLVRDQGAFAGFLMPAVDLAETVELHTVTNPSDRRAPTGNPSWVRHFSWRYLVQTAVNLANATSVLHAMGTVIGDFNERNIRVSQTTLVTLLDCDSMQITDPGTGQRFLCPVGRLEWNPPELVDADWARTVRRPSADNFALAIHLYQLLLEGEHPFRGMWARGDKPSGATLARNGVWARSGGQLSPRPNQVAFTLLPAEVRELFRRAFSDGARQPEHRPTAVQWHEALTRLAASLRQCAADPRHDYPAELAECPWCELAARRASGPGPGPAGPQGPPAGPAPSGPAPFGAGAAYPPPVSYPPPTAYPPVSYPPPPQPVPPSRWPTVAWVAAGVALLILVACCLAGTVFR